jgi:ATP-dependent Clp protease adaptor protein ClpS
MGSQSHLLKRCTLDITAWDDGNNNKKPLPLLPALNEHEPSQDEGPGHAVMTERRTEIRRPSQYQVLIHNDDYTPMDFVVMVLENFFNKDHGAATEIMFAVHNKGFGICGIYPYEIAETKVAQVMECARENEHPLQCTMEKLH